MKDKTSVFYHIFSLLARSQTCFDTIVRVMRYCQFDVSPVNYSDSDSDEIIFLLAACACAREINV